MNGRAVRTLRGDAIKDMQAYLNAQLEERDKKLISLIKGELKMQDAMSSEDFQVLLKLKKHFYETHEKSVENLIYENHEDEEDCDDDRLQEEKKAALLTPYSKSIKGRGLLEKASKYEKAKRYDKALSIYRRGKQFFSLLCLLLGHCDMLMCSWVDNTLFFNFNSHHWSSCSSTAALLYFPEYQTTIKKKMAKAENKIRGKQKKRPHSASAGASTTSPETDDTSPDPSSTPAIVAAMMHRLALDEGGERPRRLNLDQCADSDEEEEKEEKNDSTALSSSKPALKGRRNHSEEDSEHSDEDHGRRARPPLKFKESSKARAKNVINDHSSSSSSSSRTKKALHRRKMESDEEDDPSDDSDYCEKEKERKEQKRKPKKADKEESDKEEDEEEEDDSKVTATVKVSNTHTHTHTHTEREREREQTPLTFFFWQTEELTLPFFPCYFFNKLKKVQEMLNKGSEKELVNNLHGIGAKRAQAIIEYRKQKGAFREVKWPTNNKRSTRNFLVWSQVFFFVAWAKGLIGLIMVLSFLLLLFSTAHGATCSLPTLKKWMDLAINYSRPSCKVMCGTRFRHPTREHKRKKKRLLPLEDLVWQLCNLKELDSFFLRASLCVCKNRGVYVCVPNKLPQIGIVVCVLVQNSKETTEQHVLHPFIIDRSCFCFLGGSPSHCTQRLSLSFWFWFVFDFSLFYSTYKQYW